MRGVEQVRAELEGRVGLGLEHAVGVKAVFADKAVVDADGEEWKLVEAAAAKLGIEAEITPGLPGLIGSHFFPIKHKTDQSKTLPFAYLLVLDYADCTLKHTIDHEHIAGEDFHRIRYIANNLGQALDNVHTNGSIHADFKPHNAAFVGNDWKLLDFDVFCKRSKPFGSKTPSSGYCPPEMAKVLLAATDQATGKVNTPLLEPLLKEYVASEAHDLWSFGVVLYHLCFGTPLWKTDIHDNVDLEGLQVLASMSDPPLRKALDKALNKGEIRSASDNLKAAAALLRKLLEPDKKKRLEHFELTDRPMQAVIEEPFFQLGRIEAGEVMKKLEVLVAQNNRIEQIITEIDARTITIEGLQRATITKMDKHASSLRACIQAAVDDTVPTAFVILSHKPGTTPPQGVLDEVKAKLKETAEQLLAEESTSADFLKCGGHMLSLYHHGAGAIGTLKGAISDPKAFALEKLKEHAVNTLFLSLVCEVCWMPQEEAYEITVQGDTCQKVMPIAKATLSTIKALNGLAVLTQCFFPGLPSIPKSVLDEAKATIDQFDVESSVAEFDEVQSVLAKDGDREQGKQDGYCRRQFKQLLAKEDPKNEWAKLKRAILPEGKSIWMCECCTKVFEEPGNKNKSYEDLRDLCKSQALSTFKMDEVVPETVVGGGGGGDGDGVGSDGDDGVASGRALEVHTGEQELEAHDGNAYIQQVEVEPGEEAAASPVAMASTVSKGTDNKDVQAREEARVERAKTCPATLVICSLQ
jgi:hypothetical protein